MNILLKSECIRGNNCALVYAHIH